MSNTLKEHQESLLAMLKDLDTVCKKHGIGYQLFAGTALGAVRDKGFIPWDDDLDVVMLREDYGKFLSIAEKELDPKIYYVQKEFSEHWPMFFSKLRKNGTACIERQIPKDPLMHQGIYIDIFPCDNLSENAAVKKLQFFASKVVIAKSLDKRGYITDSKKKKLFIAFCRLLPIKPFLKFTQMRNKPKTKEVHTFLGGASAYIKNVYPREWFSETESIPFEDSSFPVSKYCDELLTKLYGDYMTPLPEEKRGCKVHAELVDLENSYENYIGIQNQMKFGEYTRSIR